jgi:hypothetical protein
MKDEHIKALIKETLQEENSQHTKALQKERAMRMQMYKDRISSVMMCAFLYLGALLFIILSGGFTFNFLNGVFITSWTALIAAIMYALIKADNETREERVNEMLKQVK